MRGLDLVEQSPGLSYRKLDSWCKAGVFGAPQIAPGPGSNRNFTEEDLQVAQILGRVSCALDTVNGGRGGWVSLYIELACQIRHGASVISMHLGSGVSITVDTRRTS